MLAALLLLPVLAAAASLAVRSDGARLWILRAHGALHLLFVAAFWRWRPGPALGGFAAVDDAGLLVLSVSSALFAGIGFYLAGYLRRAEPRPLRIFVLALLLFEGAVALVATSQHLGLMWVAMEASTLASAPLLYFHHSGRALEATWKYLIVSSVGIALALLGTIFFAVAAANPATGETTLWLSDLAAGTHPLLKPWLHAGYVFLLVGYGAKMGLAPMHAWKPDAYGEAPPPVAALLAGALTSCAFLGVFRATEVCAHAGEREFASSLLIVLGLLSLAVAAVFIVGQSDLRRLLAYSSVENMGVICFGLGFGLAGTEGALLQAVNNALNKGIMFLVAGNLLQLYGTSSTVTVRGAFRKSRLTGALLFAGAFAGMGMPPFGLFISEFAILRASLTGAGPVWPAALYLTLLAVIFLGMAAAILPMAQGESPDEATSPVPAAEPWSTTLPPAVFAAGALLLGVFVPPPLLAVIHGAAQRLGGP